jgi:tight adherence protein B
MLTQAVLCGLLLVGSVVTREWLLLLLVPVVLVAPAMRLERATAARVTQIDAQIEGWLGAIANSLKASPSLGEAIASTISLVPNPMSEEVSVLVKEYEFGTAFDVALDNFASRIGSQTLEGTILALKVARNSGGNLPETLESAAAALRELARLEGVVRTKTAEGKAQAFVIGAVPIPMVVGLHLIDENYFVPLLSSFAGNILIGISAILWAAAVFSAQKILAVDV